MLPNTAADELQVSLVDMLTALATALDVINPSLDAHQKRTCYIASLMAQHLKLPKDEYADVFAAAILHDIGAIGLADRMKLLAFEDVSPHLHARMGAILLESFPKFARFAPLVRCHHVRWEQGKGTEFDGQSVPFGSYLIYLADRVEVLAQVSDNILADAPKIRERIAQDGGVHFHPRAIEAFMAVSVLESFWLGLVSKQLERKLQGLAPFEMTAIHSNELLALARFYALVIDSRSHFTATHSAGVASCAEMLGRLSGMNEREAIKIKIAGFLHDMGKLAVSNDIIEKRGGLDEAEISRMRVHSYLTYEIFSQIKGLEEIAFWASSHHERLDGSGYPNHLTAEDMPLPARILCVADVYTALAEDRPYRAGLGKEKALAIIREESDRGRLDSHVVDVLEKHLDAVHEAFRLAQLKERDGMETFWELAQSSQPLQLGP